MKAKKYHCDKCKTTIQSTQEPEYCVCGGKYQRPVEADFFNKLKNCGYDFGDLFKSK